MRVLSWYRTGRNQDGRSKAHLKVWAASQNRCDECASHLTKRAPAPMRSVTRLLPRKPRPSGQRRREAIGVIHLEFAVIHHPADACLRSLGF